MPTTKQMATLRGSCHCGRLRVEFSTSENPASIVPRACDCSFCRKHGAAYVSDPAGRLLVTGALIDAHEYQQGSNAARFLVCRHCGVLMAVVYKDGSRIHGAVNASCLDDDPGLGEPVPASPQTLAPDEKVTRWREMWVPDVVLA